MPAVESVPGPTSLALEKACAESGVYAVVGLLEAVDEVVYNSALLVGPQGLIGVYRKMHLPCLGVDRFTTPGDLGFRVWETPIGRIGIAICYDLRFPEALRCLGLRGADIVALPTNWPVTSESMPEFVARARALENRIYLVACNRVGEESGFRFFGRSVMVDPAGKIMMELDDASGIGYATFDPERARQKRIVIRPGQFELDTYSNRRPSFYTTLIEE
jgi:predicted amidohydrolase